MCGISGIINKNNCRVIQNDIQEMNDLIVHRGPDDEGYYFGNNFAFGHRRLSIIDLSSDGHQPMHYLDKYTITYNGEVYNYLEIKKELLKYGYQFDSNTDTEVILASYDKWGEECVNKFNGMWAFAIFDKEKNTIFCSRDRFGIKPFYYTEVDGKFLFASEIKQLLRFYNINYVNKTILGDYLLYGLEEHTNETFFKNIYKLGASCNLIYDLKVHKYKIDKYFKVELNKKLESLSENESIECIKNRLYGSISLRLRSDVKVGTCLSGGLDSSSIAAIASKKFQEQTDEKFIAIHAKSIEKKTDESHFAQEVAKYCNLDMKIVEPYLEDITNNINEVFYTQEEPFGGPSIFMQYFVMKKAKENNCKVMLDGQGGDETLFGYENYYSVYFAGLLIKLKLVQYVKDLLKLPNFKLSKKRIMINSISILMSRSMIDKIKKLFGINMLDIKIEIDKKKLGYIFDFRTFKQFQIRELAIRNLPHLLKYEDKNSMRHSVETRLPFVDYKFVQSALSMNDSLKFKNGYLKYILRKVVTNILPKNIVWRTNKFGFEAPTDMWIDSHKDEMIKKINRSEILKQTINIDNNTLKDYKILWRLFSIAVWEEVYEVKL